jgi:hypothetical protein
LVPVRVPLRDQPILEYLEERTALSIDELIRVFLHVGLWESHDLLPATFRDALAEGRKRAKK